MRQVKLAGCQNGTVRQADAVARCPLLTHPFDSHPTRGITPALRDNRPDRPRIAMH
jgi:hypothetical protein